MPFSRHASTCKGCLYVLPIGVFEGRPRCPGCTRGGSVRQKTAAAASRAYREYGFPNTANNRKIIERHFAHLNRCTWIRDKQTRLVARPIVLDKPMGALNIVVVQKNRSSQVFNSQFQRLATHVAKWMLLQQ